MSSLVGYRVTGPAQLEADNPKELVVFIEQKINTSLNSQDKNVFLLELDKDIKSKFGQKFEVSYIDAETYLPADEYDDALLLQVDAISLNSGLLN